MGIHVFTPNDAAQSNAIAENKLKIFSSSSIVKHSNEDDGKHLALFGQISLQLSPRIKVRCLVRVFLNFIVIVEDFCY
jgi:hypothetical protein